MARIPLPNAVHPALKDQALRRAFQGMLDDDRLTRAEAETLIRVAEDGPGLSGTEQRDLERLVEKLGDRFDRDARRAVDAYLLGGVGPSALPAPVPVRGNLEASLRTPELRNHDAAGAQAWWDAVGREGLPGILFDAPMLAEVGVGGLTFAEAELLALLVDVASSHVGPEAADQIAAGGALAFGGPREGLPDAAMLARVLGRDSDD